MATIDEVYELLDTINKKTLKRMETDNANVFKRIEERFNQPKTMTTIDQVYELLDAVNKQTLKRMETDNANAFKRIEERFNQLQEVRIEHRFWSQGHKGENPHPNAARSPRNQAKGRCVDR